MLIPNKQARFPKVQYPTKKEWECPICRAKGLNGCVVDFSPVMQCGICGSIFSEITFDKSGKVIKAIKIGERKYKPTILPISANEPLTMELGEPYFEMLREPLVIVPNE